MRRVKASWGCKKTPPSKEVIYVKLVRPPWERETTAVRSLADGRGLYHEGCQSGYACLAMRDDTFIYTGRRRIQWLDTGKNGITGTWKQCFLMALILPGSSVVTSWIPKVHRTLVVAHGSDNESKDMNQNIIPLQMYHVLRPSLRLSRYYG